MDEVSSSPNRTTTKTKFERLVLTGTWLVSLVLVLTAIYLGWRVSVTRAAASEPIVPTQTLVLITPTANSTSAELSQFSVDTATRSIYRLALLHTIIPPRSRQEAVKYTVSAGDSIFDIAETYGIEPETVLWANYDQLQDDPDTISVGMELNIPPVDGVYYQWQEGDTIDKVASEFKAQPNDILSWPGNKIDLTRPEITAGQWIMIPDGKREFQQWVVPQIARANSGVSKSVYGPGACEGNYEGAYGYGYFIWPTAAHVLSGNDFWSGHLGIDIAGGLGDGVFASDSGVIVFSGWSTGGYGYMIMIDHGNGYQTLYAHLSQVVTYCGESVYQGDYIGAVGSTGNSTGPHLHFEVRYMGGFINPWYVLP
jgi:murein DD-endopeptidase MepM/ murein hydrolase activator NlpD